MHECAQLFIDFLESKELKFDTKIDSDGDSVVSFPYDGKTAKCYFSGEDGKYLTIYYFYESTPDDKVAEMLYACNQLNAKYKWVRFFLDKDNDLILQVDALLTPMSAADVAFEMLVRLLNIGKESKPTIMKALYA